MKEKKVVSLDAGNGGEEMQRLIQTLTKDFFESTLWQNKDNDSATYDLNQNNQNETKNQNTSHLVFTTDSYVVDPIEFAGANIGHLAFCGTINDLCVMGADPIGLSLALIIEEGFDIETLQKITTSISELSKKYKIPIVTGDTKVMPKSKLDKIIINTSGVGLSKKILDEELEIGDKIIISGSIADHAVALLSKRFDFQTSIISDSKPLIEELKAIRDLIKIAKDPTRAGISASLNEIAIKNNVEIIIEEKSIPIKKEVKSATNLLGLDPLELANEGKVLVITKKENSDKVLSLLKEFNSDASIIGEITSKKHKGQVILKTSLGSRILSIPSGRIVPRIC